MPEYLFLEALFGRYCRRHGLERHVACSARVFSCKKDPRADAPITPPIFFPSPDIDLYGRHRGARCDVNRKGAY